MTRHERKRTSVSLTHSFLNGLVCGKEWESMPKSLLVQSYNETRGCPNPKPTKTDPPLSGHMVVDPTIL